MDDQQILMSELREWSGCEVNRGNIDDLVFVLSMSQEARSALVRLVKADRRERSTSMRETARYM